MAGAAGQKQHGPFPYLLLALTFVTGLADASSFFRLHHVFVGNMTGNVLFLAFALSGARDFSLAASGLALVSFLSGAIAGGRCAKSFGEHRARYFAMAMSINVVAFGASTTLAAFFPHTDNLAIQYVLIAMLGIAMGNQNAAAQRLGVPDLNTTVLTQTLTRLASESQLAGASHGRPHWRLASVAVMFAGAAAGAALVLKTNAAIAIGLAFLIVIGVEIVALRLRRSNEPWATGAPS